MTEECKELNRMKLEIVERICWNCWLRNFRKPLLPSLVFSFPSCIHVMQQAVFLVVICLHTLIIRMCKWYTYKSITYVNDTHVKHISLFAKNLHFQCTKKFVHAGAKTLVHIPFLNFFFAFFAKNTTPNFKRKCPCP